LNEIEAHRSLPNLRVNVTSSWPTVSSIYANEHKEIDRVYRRNEKRTNLPDVLFLEALQKFRFRLIGIRVLLILELFRELLR
jgi:hypothetical protein